MLREMNWCPSCSVYYLFLWFRSQFAHFFVSFEIHAKNMNDEISSSTDFKVPLPKLRLILDRNFFDYYLSTKFEDQ